ncbi:S1 RNA-binding domain-containing protein [Candidatus Uhrbacteria bacterium]|nr:S1 RNA-binding domain-containing protein [Candidatus Uhrbacteria bacterium]
MDTATKAGEVASEFKTLLEDKANLRIPKVGELVHGTVVGIGRNEVKIDITGFRAGIVRGKELVDESGATANVAVGDAVEAVVVDLENERGMVELSFRSAGHQKAWNELMELRRAGTVTPVRVLDANKGGLLVQLGRVKGFLPVSQLSPGNYPRVTGGDRQRIFEKLKSFVGKVFDVKVIDIDEREEKLIVSEKAAWEEGQAQVLARYHVGDIIEGDITALADFGAFVRFSTMPEGTPESPTNYLEGLIHISELAWQRVEHPRDVLTMHQHVRCQIINIEGSKIFLSLKRLSEDPWVKASERYQIGQAVDGKVVKVQPFGLFVELDPDIHGLAHVSELGDPAPSSPDAVAKVGETHRFSIISIDPKEHRLGLRLVTDGAAPASASEAPSETPPPDAA